MAPGMGDVVIDKKVLIILLKKRNISPRIPVLFISEGSSFLARGLKRDSGQGGP
jgi:hypothetical protein